MQRVQRLFSLTVVGKASFRQLSYRHEQFETRNNLMTVPSLDTLVFVEILTARKRAE
jgi:hypothetical protein